MREAPMGRAEAGNKISVVMPPTPALCCFSRHFPRVPPELSILFVHDLCLWSIGRVCLAPARHVRVTTRSTAFSDPLEDGARLFAGNGWPIASLEILLQSVIS